MSIPHIDLLVAMKVIEEERARVKRIDPPECGCTDCLTGYSVPLDAATDVQILDMVRGQKQNATSMSWAEIHTWLINKKASV